MPAKSRQPSKPTKSTPATKSISKVSKSKVSKHPPGSMFSRWDMDAKSMRKVKGAAKKTKKRKASAKFLAAGNAWRAHVQETMRKNPNMKFGKELLRLAKKTYKKGSSSSHGTIKVANSKYSVQVRPKTKRAKAKKTKRAKKRTSRNRSRLGFFGL